MKLKRSLLLRAVSALTVFGCDAALVLDQTHYTKDGDPTGLSDAVYRERNQWDEVLWAGSPATLKHEPQRATTSGNRP